MPAGYEHRRSQLEMAELVDQAFQSKQHLLVEAGTGTGKTLAYLIDHPVPFRSAPELFCLDLYRYFDIDTLSALGNAGKFSIAGSVQ